MKIALFILLFLMLYLSRPSYCEHKNKLANVIAESLNIENDNAIYDASANFILNKKTVYNDYYFATTTSVNGKIITFGFLNIVFLNVDVIQSFLL